MYLCVKSSDWSCICVLRVSIFPLSTIFLLDFGTVQTMWYFINFHLLFLLTQGYFINLVDLRLAVLQPKCDFKLNILKYLKTNSVCMSL